MADGYESDRTEAYFSGRLKPAPRPRRLAPAEPPEERPRGKGQKAQDSETE